MHQDLRVCKIKILSYSRAIYRGIESLGIDARGHDTGVSHIGCLLLQFLHGRITGSYDAVTSSYENFEIYPRKIYHQILIYIDWIVFLDLCDPGMKIEDAWDISEVGGEHGLQCHECDAVIVKYIDIMLQDHVCLPL